VSPQRIPDAAELGPVGDAAEAFIEARSDGAIPKSLVRVIRAGLSRNRNLYLDPVLKDAVPLLEGVRVDAAAFAAMRLRMANQAELGSAAKLGLVLRHLAVPGDLEETAFSLFVRNTNQDETFVQSRKPTVHVIPHWTDANNWYGFADRREIPLIEMGFCNGREEPELFIQDNPTQGSLFSNDQIKYKMRHIYKGAVMDWRCPG